MAINTFNYTVCDLCEKTFIEGKPFVIIVSSAHLQDLGTNIKSYPINDGDNPKIYHLSCAKRVI